MDALRRAAKTLARTPSRSLLLILVLALSVGLFAALVQSAVAVDEEADRLEATYATQVEVRRAGATQMGAGVDLLPEQAFANVSTWEHVEQVDRYLLVRAVNDSMPEAPISITVGTPVDGQLRVTTHGAEGRVTPLAGRTFAPQDAGERVALVGKTFAETRGLVDDAEAVRGTERADYGTVELNGTTFRVVGLFETGFAFGDNQVMVPYEVAQETFGKQGQFTTLWVTVDEAQNTGPVAQRLETTFDEQIQPLGVDVLAGTESVDAVLAGLSDVRRTSLLGAGLAGLGAALVTGFALAAVTLERTREIGTMRALGAAPRDVAAQFAGEAGLIALAGAAVGIGVFAVLGPWVVARLLGAPGGGGALMGHAESALSGVSVGLSLTALAVAAMVALALASAVVGSLFPVRYVSRLDPVEALRGEAR